MENKKIIAYLRVIEPGVAFANCSIGRVLCIQRRKGIASSLLDEAIHTAKTHFKATSIYLEAQVYARTLYEKKGFKAVTEEFMEDGIPHIGMLLEL